MNKFFLNRITVVALAFWKIVAFASIANAHFVWVYPEDGKIKIVFGEGLEPDQAQFLDGLSGMKVWSLDSTKPVPLEFARRSIGEEGWFEVAAEKAGHAVDISCLYGVFGGADSTMLLDYSAKYLKFDSSIELRPSNNLQLDLVPRMVGGKLQVTSYFNGQPIEGVALTAHRLESDVVDATTSKNGAAFILPPDRYVIRGKYVVKEPGEHEGKTFEQKRFYCTLVLDLNSEIPASAVNSKSTVSLERSAKGLPDLPLGLTSFGASVVGDQVFVVGGKEGKAHSYAKSYQNRVVFCLNDNDKEPEWQTVGECNGLQGLAIVGFDQKLYRIGGLEARNVEGEDHDLVSVRDFVEFDPATKQWRELPDLPEGRSSFDACLVGSKIYVVGGWTMLGNEDSRWSETGFSFDLGDSNATWQTFEVPFKVRAMSLTAFQEKLYVIGGITPDDGPTSNVHVYDLRSEKWSEGSPIPATGSMKAFGCSSAVVDGHLLVSTYDGGIHLLDKLGESWMTVHELEPGRFFHQMLPLGETEFVLVGGAHMDVGKITETTTFLLSSNDSSSNDSSNGN